MKKKIGQFRHKVYRFLYKIRDIIKNKKIKYVYAYSLVEWVKRKDDTGLSVNLFTK